MLGFNKLFILGFMLIMMSGCRVETHSENFVLDIHFIPAYEEQWGWAAATAMVFRHQGIYYHQADLVDYQYHYFGYRKPSINDISWLLWDLGGLDSYVTSTLTFGEIRSQLNQGKPILLQYGAYYSGHVLVLHGYDHQGHVYIHEPGYGTRVMHYDDLYYRYFQGSGRYWESSLILEH